MHLIVTTELSLKNQCGGTIKNNTSMLNYMSQLTSDYRKTN